MDIFTLGEFLKICDDFLAGFEHDDKGALPAGLMEQFVLHGGLRWRMNRSARPSSGRRGASPSLDVTVIRLAAASLLFTTLWAAAGHAHAFLDQRARSSAARSPPGRCHVVLTGIGELWDESGVATVVNAVTPRRSRRRAWADEEADGLRLLILVGVCGPASLARPRIGERNAAGGCSVHGRT
jgi:hypothetical protein